MKTFNLAKWLAEELAEKDFTFADVLMVSDADQSNFFALGHLLKTIDVDVNIFNADKESDYQTFVDEFNLHMHDGSLVIYKPDNQCYDYTEYVNNITFYLSPQRGAKKLSIPELTLALEESHQDNPYNGPEYTGNFLNPEEPHIKVIDLKRTFEYTGHHVYYDRSYSYLLAQYNSINQKLMINTDVLTGEHIQPLIDFISSLPAQVNSDEFMDQVKQIIGDNVI